MNALKMTCTFETPLGPMIALAEGDSLCGLWFVGQRYEPEGTDRWLPDAENPLFRSLGEQLNRYFKEGLATFDLPLAPRGTAFQRSVWELLRLIPLGETTTYGRLALRLSQLRDGHATSPRAVGTAVGHNPLSIVIPCHRVIGADGALTGYAGGLERKAFLLALERGGASSPYLSRSGASAEMGQGG